MRQQNRDMNLEEGKEGGTQGRGERGEVHEELEEGHRF